MDLRGFLEDYLHSYKHAENFARWAWGEGFNEIELISAQSVESWNSRHGDKLRIDPLGDPREDIFRMVQLWKEENEMD